MTQNTTIWSEWTEPAPRSTVEGERAHHLQRLAASFRIFGRLGFDYGGAGHITVRDPEWPDTFWVNPAGVPFGHIRVRDLLHVDERGAILRSGETQRLNYAAFAIHQAIHAHRPDVAAAAHAHSVYGKAWSTVGELLEPITQDACAFYEDHRIYKEFSGVVLEPDEGARIAQALGNKRAVFLQNHGVLTVGASIEAAVWNYIAIEDACRVQLLTRAAGSVTRISHEVARRTAAQVGSAAAAYHAFELYFQLVRREHAEIEG